MRETIQFKTVLGFSKMFHRYHSVAKNGAHLNSIFVNNLLTVKARDTIQIFLEST